MTNRVAPLAALLTTVGLLLWLASTGGEGPGPGPDEDGAGDASSLRDPGPGGGSAVPCAVPLAWRLARLDPEFGIPRTAALRALSEGAALWEQAAGRRLLPRDSAAGFPIRLVYDARQARTAERRRLEDSTSREAQRLTERRRAILSAGAALDSAEAAHGARVDRLRDRVERHNAEVRRWNAAGDPPPDRLRELEAIGDRLAAERERLDRERLDLLERRRSLEETEQGYDLALEEHVARLDSLRAAFPPTPVESGRYREAVRLEDGRPVAVGREIRIHRFDVLDDLRLIAAHELGHALGLGHTDAPGALMGRTYDWRSFTSRGAPLVLHPEDVALLRARCPELAGR